MDQLPIIERTVRVADNGWTGLLFLVVLLIFGLVLSLYGGQFQKRMKLLNLGRTRIISYDDNAIGWLFVSLLWLATIVSLSLTVSAIIARISGNVIDLMIFLVTFAISAVYIAAKFGLMYLMRYIFDLRENVFIEEMKIVVVGFGAISSIVGLAVAYVSNQNVGIVLCSLFLFIGIVVEGVLLVKNFYRGISSLFYIFLYLCAAEILPLFIGVKWVSQVLN